MEVSISVIHLNVACKYKSFNLYVQQQKLNDLHLHGFHVLPDIVDDIDN